MRHVIRLEFGLGSECEPAFWVAYIISRISEGSQLEGKASVGDMIAGVGRSATNGLDVEQFSKVLSDGTPGSVRTICRALTLT
eukprot:scaffold1576_cov192-Alexandrium_tamarense.AAC.4